MFKKKNKNKTTQPKPKYKWKWSKDGVKGLTVTLNDVPKNNSDK